jgi:hypothetical protein
MLSRTCGSLRRLCYGNIILGLLSKDNTLAAAFDMARRPTALAAEEPASSFAPRSSPRLELRQYRRPTRVTDERLEVLLQRQVKHCPRILQELRAHGYKTSHWAWWVFPTEKEGFSEPSPATCVTTTTAAELLRRAPLTWRQCLEEIASLAATRCDEGRTSPEASSRGDGRGTGRVGLAAVLPPIDLPRVKYFLLFWRAQAATPPWLHAVCDRLEV